MDAASPRAGQHHLHPLGAQRIAFVSDAWLPQINGVVRVLQTLQEKLVVRGHRVEVFAPNQFNSIPCPTYPEIPLSVLPGRALARVLERFRPNAIHIATEGPLGFAGRAWCQRHGVPFTTAYHTKFPEYVHARTRLPLPWLYGVMKWFHRPSAGVLAPSASVYRELTIRGFANARQWSHGVDPTIFRPVDKDILNLPRPVHLFVGRIAVEKNLPAFLDLELSGSKVVVGDGPQRDALIEAYPDAHFRIANGDAELARYFSAADVFVFPSRTDTFGLTMLESLACGVPVAAFPVTGPLDVLGLQSAGEADFGCLDKDLMRAIDKALGKSPEACRQHALGFSWDRVVDEFLANLAPIQRTGI
jgi:glycosyltransferase involved in cell wall biosynthesis